MPVPLPTPDHVFALLDDASDGVDARRSRLYTGCVRTLESRQGDAPHRLLDELQRALAEGLHAVGLFAYEFGFALQRVDKGDESTASLATVLLFERCDTLSADEVNDWLSASAGASPHGITDLSPALDEAEFAAAIDAIHRYIESGDCYQANFTFPLRFAMHGNAVALYAALRTRQPVPYGALVALPDGRHVLSLSPELFVSHRDGRFECRPMKGTARASGDAVLDAARAQALTQSDKERSENLMIVDLLRNDLGRIAVTGSVKVPALFTVERYGEVLQMTSTVMADAREGLGLREVFDALYPCGSITGAPKRRTMQILQQLERWPRGLYTGAIGWFEPPRTQDELGDFTLSVPIRTLLLDAPDANERRRGELGVGAGIVYDSDAQAEYRECLLKANFLSGLAPGFSLFETMRATRDGVPLLERHLARLSASARSLGFAFDDAQARARIDQAWAALDPDRSYRLRLALDASGTLQLQTGELAPLPGPVRVQLSARTMPSDDPLLAHKTTLRRVYDEGWKQAEAAGAFDTLFFNERGELTEGGRSNVFVRIAGQWLTPPLSSGLLPGVMRSVLLDDAEWKAGERPITKEELRVAEAICVCNALRGVLAAEVVWDA